MSGQSPIDQVARAMVAVVKHAEDVPTIRVWCLIVGKSRSSLSALCALAGVAPKAALDLARLLRAVRCSPDQDLRAAFHVADPRTIERLLTRSGRQRGNFGQSLEGLLDEQRLIANRRVIAQLRAALRAAP